MTPSVERRAVCAQVSDARAMITLPLNSSTTASLKLSVGSRSRASSSVATEVPMSWAP